VWLTHGKDERTMRAAQLILTAIMMVVVVVVFERESEPSTKTKAFNHYRLNSNLKSRRT